MAKTWTQEVDEGFLHAVIEGDLSRAKYYAEKGADLKQQDPEGKRNPLRLAAIRGHFHIVKYLVEEKNVKPSEDIRVLHMTIMGGERLKDIFIYLVNHGADINGIDPTLGTPLMLSIRDGEDFKLTKWLVETMHARVDVTTDNGSALHNACEHGDLDIIDFLFKHNGLNVAYSLDSREFTPLTVAAFKGRNEVIKFLVKNWKVDINSPEGVHPLFMAVQHDAIPTVSLLISMGANVNVIQTDKNCSPLHLAASNNFLDIVKLLVDHKANVNIQDSRGYTPLLMAASEGYTECVKRLADAGADVNHRSMDDYTTAIYHAANANRIKVVRLLLEKGADPLTTRNEKGETLAEIARQNKKEDMANLLETWVSLPVEERHKMCVTCNKFIEGEMKRCGACKIPWYCSPACQKKDWEKHKLECKK
jgi:ankyrin repeat protein